MSLFRIIQKYKKILSKHQKIRVVEIAILMLVAGFFEMLSVSLILPFVNAITDPEKFMEGKYIGYIYELLHVSDYRSLFVIMSIAMALLYFVKNAFLLFEVTIQNKFVYANMFITQQALLRNYLARPYEYFLSIKSGEVVRIIGEDTHNAFILLTHIMSFFSESIISIVLVITVFIISPITTLTIGGILVVFIILIHSITRPLLRKAGRTKQKASASMNQWLLQSIQGIKEIKLMKKENYFKRMFEIEGKKGVKASYQDAVYGFVPRYMIEAVTMCSIFIAVAVQVCKGVELITLIPTVSAIAMAAVRLIPSANRISISMSAIAFGEPAVDKLLENLNDLELCIERELDSSENKTTAISISNMKDNVSLENVTYMYPSGTSYILNDANLKIEKGMSIGIVGSSGSGKTTAVDILLGLLRPQNGRVTVDGKDIEQDMNGWLDNIGYIPQQIFMLDGSIRENVAFGVEKNEIEEEKVLNSLKEAALYEFVESLPNGLDTEIGERGLRISGGQRQRLGIARALYANPSILIFDEATSALDNETESAIMESINNLHGLKTMIIIAHRLSTIESCDAVYRVDNGKILRER